MSTFVAEKNRPADVAAEHSPFDLPMAFRINTIGVGELFVMQEAIREEEFVSCSSAVARRPSRPARKS